MMALVLVFLILNTPRIILGVIEVSQLKNVELCYELLAMLGTMSNAQNDEECWNC